LRHAVALDEPTEDLGVEFAASFRGRFASYSSVIGRFEFGRHIGAPAARALPEEFMITLNSRSYLTAQEPLTLGLASLIFDVRTMKMVWSFNGQGMLGMKGETVLFQCH
jgi:hypothetical protein